MLKKKSFVFAAGAFLTLSIIMPAQTAPPTLTSSTLGVLEGTLDFCSKVNPQAADQIKEIRMQLTKDKSEDSLARMRKSQEYKESHGRISKQLAALPAKDAQQACKAQTK